MVAKARTGGCRDSTPQLTISHIPLWGIQWDGDWIQLDEADAMQATFTTNLRCQSCLSTVGPRLDQQPLVKSWEVDLEDARKLLHVKLADEDAVQVVTETLAKAGYSAELLDKVPPAEGSEDFSLSTYRPLLLVLAYVLGATLLFESIHDSFLWTRATSYFMGFFFLAFAFFKLLNVAGFADAFATYDILAKRSRGYALAYPTIELALGILYVTQAAPLVANLATVGVMAIGLVGVLSVLREKRSIQCACLGTVFNLPMSKVTVVENSVMLVMAVSMLIATSIS